jgi:hypothetical protein
MSMSFALPPRNTFFNLALSASLSLLASYISPNLKPVIGAGKLELPYRPSDGELCEAIQGFVGELVKGEYGLAPPLDPDARPSGRKKRARLSSLQEFLSKITGSSVVLKADSLLNAYAKYACELARKGQLVHELGRALSVFRDGYPNDAQICDVPMLITLAPEFMEGVRVLGGVGLGAVPNRYSFSRMRVGPHSVCLGIAGLWATLVAAQDNLLYFAMPYTPAVVSVRVGDRRDAQKGLMRALRGCVPRSVPSLVLAVALSTAGISEPARETILVVVQRGGRRVDLLEQGLPLSLDTILLFADELYLEDQRLEEWERVVPKLLKLVVAGLREPPTGVRDAQCAQRLHEVGLRAAQLLYLTLTRVLKPHELRYELARLLYARSDVDFEDCAKRRGMFLAPRDDERAVSAVERALLTAQVGVPIVP